MSRRVSSAVRFQPTNRLAESGRAKPTATVVLKTSPLSNAVCTSFTSAPTVSAAITTFALAPTFPAHVAPLRPSPTPLPQAPPKLLYPPAVTYLTDSVRRCGVARYFDARPIATSHQHIQPGWRGRPPRIAPPSGCRLFCASIGNQPRSVKESGLFSLTRWRMANEVCEPARSLRFPSGRCRGPGRC